jgi:DNA-directed RNA polymerase specialized sigma24 family protein
MAQSKILDDRAVCLHQRLCSGDEVASSALAELFLPVLTKGLSRKYPNLSDPSWVPTACADALMNYFAVPGKYSPERGKLLTYLWKSAEGDLLNLLAKERRRAVRQISEQVVEFRLADREVSTEPMMPPDVELESVAETSPSVQRAMGLLNSPEDRQFVELMMSGIRATEEFAKVLRISDLPSSEQGGIVKRNKDRIKKTIQRGLKRTSIGQAESI